MGGFHWEQRVAELEAKNAATAEKKASVEKEQKNAPAANGVRVRVTLTL